ncbi:hypothetical protein KHA80_12830 [Anaerobacillus sp. HL2]|nr:hypothetical protein KHA80_12830 [Anaerobacillus sp. HL2]
MVKKNPTIIHSDLYWRIDDATLLNLVDSISIPIQLKMKGLIELQVAYEYGIYSRGLTLVQIVVVFIIPLILPLIPYITAALANNEKENKICY